MNYINAETLQIVSIQDIKLALPNTSFSEQFIPPEPYYYIFPYPKPEHDPKLEYVIEGQPRLTDKGNWEQTWVVLPRFTEYTKEDGTIVTVQEQIDALNAQELAAQLQALQNSIISSVQQRLDDFARTKNYDGILSACTYATDPNPKFAQEGQYCVNARSQTWATLYTILEEVTSGTRLPPASYADIEAELPVLSWNL